MRNALNKITKNKKNKKKILKYFIECFALITLIDLFIALPY